MNHYDTCPDVIATLEEHAKVAESENTLYAGWKENFARLRRFNQQRSASYRRGYGRNRGYGRSRGYGRRRGGRNFGSRSYSSRGHGSFLTKTEFDEFAKVK